ncbi:MAG: T9SS type A sorting domain-containing protein [Bacteroidia bacterium]|nr:T9SS type A sorting domain-containing protein [Bacteroidia bacterium]
MLYIVFPNTTNAQIQYNLVPNYSFEQYTNCPSSSSMQEVRNSKPDYWYKPDRRNAIYYNACANGFNSNYTGVPINAGTHGYNFQYARTGNGYVAMFYYNHMDTRNYIQVQLLDSLRQGKCYYAEYYVNLINSINFGCNNQSMLFTNTPIYADTATGLQIIPANPQVQHPAIVTDTLNWVKVSAVFTAQGGEKFLTLGNFKNNAQTATQLIQTTGYSGAAYYIEDVSVIPLDSITLKADAGTDRTINLGDSTFIGSYLTGLTNVNWFNSTGNVIATNVSGLFVKPAASTFYVIEQNVCGQYSKDTVYITVGVVPLVIKNYELKIKNEGVVNKWITLNEINVSHFNVQRSSNGIEFNTIQQTAAKNNAYNEYSITDVQPLNGTSYYRIETVDKDGKITYSKTEKVQIKIDKEQLTIYPNPAKGIININYPNIREVSILDMAGRKLVAKSFNNSNLVQLNVASLSKGIYILQAINNKGDVQTQKLIIE